ncbi:MAG: sugar phosphate isomerase/epimerase [Planctomycetes bacterium]|nr:sugar phosphate isomerase/epimerase [Planctomycetota bacterium]
MGLGRREFFIRGAAAAAGLGIGAQAMGADEAPEKKVRRRPFESRGVLKISSQEGIIPGKSLGERLEKMEKWGFDGLEVWGGGLPKRVKEIQDALAKTKIELSAICAGYDGVLISEDENVRKKAVASMKEILAAAGELKSTGLICVPAFNNQTKLENKEARKILVDLLPELGEAAKAAGTRVLMEPLNRGEAFFLRQLADAASICRDVNHPAVCMMGDFYHMRIEETSDLGAFISAGSYLHHVHLASRARNLPGQDERSFVAGFVGLKLIGYRDFSSLECGVQGDRETEIPKSVAFLRAQWEEANPMRLLRDGV